MLTIVVDGLRVDSALEVDQAFLSSFNSAAGVYAMGEVFNGNPYTMCPIQDSIDGMLNYPA